MLPTHRLAAILFTDIVGSTAIMQKDEQAALSVNKRYSSVLKQFTLSYGGEILNDYGDGSLCCFSSATEAMRCAIKIQQELQAEPKVPLRIGLHVGEIFIEEGKVFGDGVNVASRVQSLGVANSILFSSEINSKIRNQQEFKSVFLGKFEFKHVDEPIEVFALANEGLIVPKKEEMIGKLKEIQEKSHLRKWIIAAVAILILVASYLFYQHFFYATGFSGEKTIAVLPFENIGVPDSEEYVSDGITQDMIGSLSNISSLKKVIGWLSVKRFKKTTKSPEEIANELGVAAILSGSMQIKGEKTRIIIELIEVGTKKRLWGDDFEFYSKDILTAQSKVPEEIVSALKASITPEEKRELTRQYSENPEAYRLYRKGLYFWNKNNQTGFDSAEIYYRKAIEIDPDYAIAFSGLANCYILSRKLSQLESIPIAKIYAEETLSLDSTLSEAWATLGLIQSYFDYDWVKSKSTLEKAIQLNSNNADAHLFYGNLLQYTGESAEQGIKEVKRALELDPLNTRYNWVLARNYYLDHQYDLAYKQVSKTLILDPNYAMAKETLIFLYMEKKMYPQAFELISQMPNIPVSNLSYQDLFLCYYLAASGDSSHAKSQLQIALKNAKFPHNLFFAYTYIALKNYSEALTFLEKSYEKREILLYWVKVDPLLDPIRNEPRFKTLMRKMHLE